MSSTTAPDAGTIPIPEAPTSAPTDIDDLEAAIGHVRGRARAWAGLDLADRIALLDRAREDTLRVADDWAAAAAEAKGIPAGSPLRGEDWLTGPIVLLRHLRLLRDTLQQIADTGRPQPPGIRTLPDGQVVVDVFPAGPLDRALFTGFDAEIRVAPGVTADEVEARMGRVYRDGGDGGGVVAVLGAGNVSSIPPTDALTKLYNEHRVVVLKMNPVNAHLGPHLEQALAGFVEEGYLRVVYGGTEVGDRLVTHPDVDAVHMTGSDKTHDAIVFGTGEEGERRRRERDPRLDVPITSELGNVSPVIVVPGPWTDGDMAFQGDNIASMLVQNAGFNCVAARVIVQHAAWTGRRRLLDAVRDSLRRAEPRHAYYPGARERWNAFVGDHRQAEWYGPSPGGDVPFTLIPEIPPDDRDATAFNVEAFCGVIAETALDAPRSVPDFLDRAVEFCNERLWGSLAATVIIHPRTLRDAAARAALDRALRDLRYGAVVVNHWSAVAFGMLTTSWGAYPGHPLHDIRSGRGVVHNTFMVEDVEKSIARGPFRLPLTPAWFHTHRTLDRVGPRLARLEATGSWGALPGVVWHGMRG